MPIKVMIADAQPIARVGIRNVLSDDINILFCHETNNGSDLLKNIPIHNPDIIILDLYLQITDGLTILKEVQASHPQIKTIVFSNNEDVSVILECIELGAQAYLSKKDGVRELRSAINALYAPNGDGKLGYMNKLVQDALWKGRKNLSYHAELTEKEKVYLELFCKGMEKEEIARAMNFSVRTIEQYRYTVMRKTNTKNDVLLITYALQHGLHPLKELL